MNNIDYSTKSQEELNDLFFDACRISDIDTIKYLIQSNYVDIHVENDVSLIVACDEGQLDVVKYLLSSSDLKEHCDIHINSDAPLRSACVKGHLEIVKYLLTSSELTEHSNVHSDEDAAFRYAYRFGEFDILKFLIFDMNIEKTEYVQECLSEKENSQIENWFAIRELQKDLKQELSNTSINEKRLKV